MYIGLLLALSEGTPVEDGSGLPLETVESAKGSVVCKAGVTRAELLVVEVEAVVVAVYVISEEQVISGMRE